MRAFDAHAAEEKSGSNRPEENAGSEEPAQNLQAEIFFKAFAMLSSPAFRVLLAVAQLMRM